MQIIKLICIVGCSLFESNLSAASKEEKLRDALQLFEENGKLRRFELTVTDSAWRWLQRNALKEEYIPAQLTIDTVPIGEVGLRYKGSWSTLSLCYDEVERKPTCPRLSLKIKFNHTEPGKKVNGLQKINLHSMVKDGSFLREKVSYTLFELAGQKGPRSSHAWVSVNNQAYGLYSMVEAVDDRFVKSRWPGSGNWNLYKEIWPYSSQTSEKMARHMKSSSGVVDPKGMIGLSDRLPSILQNKDTATFLSLFSLEETLKYLALDEIVKNFDGYQIFYCPKSPNSIEECAPHNFYWYEDLNLSRFTLIPWDYDKAFPGSSGELTGLPKWYDLSYDCGNSFPRKTNQSPVWPAVCHPYFRFIAIHFKTEYRKLIYQLMEAQLNTTHVHTLVDRWAAELESYVENDTLYTTEEWMSNVARLKTIYSARINELTEEYVDSRE